MKLQPSSKYPILFDRLHPGSLFLIVQERSRAMRASRDPFKDSAVYRRAKDHEGFYATNVATGEACILMPEDIVQPVREVRGN